MSYTENIKEQPKEIIMVTGDSHLNSENYGYHINYAEETLVYEEIINKIIDKENVNYYINGGDFVLHKDFSLAYRSKVDKILEERQKMIKNRNGKMIYLRGNHDTTGKSLTEYDYYAQRNLFVPACNQPTLDFKNSKDEVVLHLELKDYGDTSAIQPYGKTNILITHFYGIFDCILEGDEIPKYGQPLDLSNKTNWAGLDYILAGHIHVEHIVRGQIDGRNCTVHYLPCLARPAYIKRCEEGPNPVKEGCIDLIKVYEDHVYIERYPIPFLDNNVCFNIERIRADAAKLELSMIAKDRQEALKNMAEELLQYETRETDPIQQVMQLGNASEKHKNIVKEWFEEAQDNIKRGVTLKNK